MSMSVCLSVCLSVRLFVCMYVCPLVYVENHMADFQQFLCMLPVALARSFSDKVVISYVLPVLLMTLCFHTVGHMGQNKARHYISIQFARWRHQLYIRQLAFWSSS